MKNAFTMIEMIFVIVILGILAAVAIPRLAATRTDAMVSKMAQNIMVGAAEISTYAMSKAKTESNLSKMSNAISMMVDTGDATLDVENKKAIIKFGNVADCITMQIVTNANDDNLTISYGNSGSDSKCAQLQTAVDAEKYPMKLRGANLAY